LRTTFAHSGYESRQAARASIAHRARIFRQLAEFPFSRSYDPDANRDSVLTRHEAA
jgi:hypothetical protein